MKTNKRLFFLFVIIISNILFKPLNGENVFDSTNRYTKKEILFMPWGDGKNNVGLKEEDVEYNDGASLKKDETRTTPARIKVDGKGNIYFEDIVKWKAVKYNPQNKTIEKHEGNEGFLKVLIDREQDGLYIFNSSKNSVDIILSGKKRYRKIDRHITELLIKSAKGEINEKESKNDQK